MPGAAGAKAAIGEKAWGGALENAGGAELASEGLGTWFLPDCLRRWLVSPRKAGVCAHC